jgi:hypothetical protein
MGRHDPDQEMGARSFLSGFDKLGSINVNKCGSPAGERKVGP